MNQPECTAILGSQLLSLADYPYPTVLSLIDQLDALLPQTQCQRCGFPRCYEYAEALASGKSEVNRCPPGSAYTRNALAGLLDVTPGTLNPECGTETPRMLYYINEEHCIACTLCIQACPVDAIIGSAKKMHSILANECTGCDLCIPVCPVDCILSKPYADNLAGNSGEWLEYTNEEVSRARRRTNARLNRLENIKRNANIRSKPEENESDHIRREIAAAIKRVDQKNKNYK